MADPQRPDVLIVGAGVIGLQSAVTLLEAGYSVRVVAKHLPGDQSIEYTSPWAGAHWRPHGTAADGEQCEWDMQSYHAWMTLYRRELADSVPEAERSGIMPMRSRLLWDSSSHAELQPKGDPTNIWFAAHVNDFKVTSPPRGGAAAAQFTAFTVNVPKYLAYLARRIAALGGRIIRTELPLDGGLDAALAAAGPARIFVNATGLAARRLCADARVHPARGQTLLVRGVARGCVTRQGDEYIAYCIPQPESGLTVVGGTKGLGRWDGAEDKDDTRAILERAKGICPELLVPFKDRQNGQFEVLGVNVGLRPMRHGGARMEVERLTSGKTVVHAYGHGGAGFQNSYGVAARVLQMVRAAESSKL